jgi:hypothetical protein
MNSAEGINQMAIEDFRGWMAGLCLHSVFSVPYWKTHTQNRGWFILPVF